MCGIGGASLSETSTLNIKQFSNAMLSALEYRGTHASGFGYVAGEDRGYYKDAVKGSQLSLKQMPKDARTVILHTRFATQGRPEVNANNHPVISPGNDLMLVHNGMVEDVDVRYGTLRGVEMPEVDSAIIPALIEREGLAGSIEHLEGDAAIAWLDSKTADVLHLARLNNSPVAYTWLLDGSFVFASTDELLAQTLQRLGVMWVGNYPKPFGNMENGQYFAIQKGDVIENEMHDTSEMDNMRLWGFRGATAGGHDKRSTKGIGGGWLTDAAGNEIDDYDTPADEQWWNDQFDEAEEFADGALFYTLDHDGNFEGYASLDILLNKLVWFAGLSTDMEIGGVEGEERWINHFLDVGTTANDGTALESWVDHPEFTYLFEDSEDGRMDFVRSGARALQRIMAS